MGGIAEMVWRGIAGQRWWLMGVGSLRRCGHFPDQILIDPTARNKALLKHNPLSGITG